MDLKPLPSAKSSHTPEPCLPGIGPEFPATTTCELSPAQGLLPMDLPSMSSAAGSRARTSALTATVRALLASAPGSGLNTRAWLASYDPALSSWRTLQSCWVEGSEKFSVRWPRSGMTQNGIAYGLRALDCPTTAIGFGLLPTPMASDFKGGCKTGRLSELKHFLLLKFGMKYPPVSLLTDMMGFPEGWAEITDHRKPSATPSCLKSRS